MVKNWKDNLDSFKQPREKLRKRVYKGIPDQVRGEAWSLLMEVPRVKKEQEGRYKEMLEWGLLHSTDVRQIDLDVNRTFRNNLMFKDRYDIKQQELFRILVAYSVYNSEIGYCQGMSQVAALLLMYLHDEEDAFWALDRLMTDDRYAMHGFFIPGFPKLNRFAKHHDLVLKKYLPKVYKHFRKFDIDSTLYTLKWFFQCFLDRVPFSLTLRLWDVFMMEGEVVLTCMSYTLLKLHKSKSCLLSLLMRLTCLSFVTGSVIRKGMEELIEFLQVDLEKDFGYHDDEAITALQQSILELKKHKMQLPKDPPPETEKPTRPFGLLLQADNISIATDTHSMAGSIVLRPDGTSIPSRRSSSLTDIDELVEPNNVSKNPTKLFDQLKAIDSSRSPTSKNSQVVDVEIEDPNAQDNQIREREEEKETTTIRSSEEKHVYFKEQSLTIQSKDEDEREPKEEKTEHQGNGKIHPLIESPIGSPNPISVFVAMKETAIISDMSSSGPIGSEADDGVKDVVYTKSERETKSLSPVPSHVYSHPEVSRGASSPPTVGRKEPSKIRTSATRRTSIPKVIPPQKRVTSPIHSLSASTSPTQTNNTKQSFIPRAVKSPTHSLNKSPEHDVTTISVGLGKNDAQPLFQEKVRIYVKYREGSSPESNNGMTSVREPLPAVDT